MKKTVFIGSVLSSKVALETLLENNISVDLVCSLDEEASINVSDYYPIHNIAIHHKIPYIKFSKIYNPDVCQRICEISPNYIFVIGLSQIVPIEMINMASEYTIGFHPTPLPQYRGRAAIPWQIILGIKNSMVTIFRLDQGMDSGDIICQSSYTIETTDYANDVYMKITKAMRNALVECIPRIYSNSVNFISQNSKEATYLLARRPEDGEIVWRQTAREIETLVRASSKPYPGAFSYYKGKKLIIWRAQEVENEKYTGIPGQIAWINENKEIAVITTDAMLVMSDYQYESDGASERFIVGHKFKSMVVMF